MEKLDQYRVILRLLVEQAAQRVPSHDEIEAIALCDAARDHYQLLHLGSGRQGRVFAVIIHLRLRDGKVWVERDGTAEGVATALLGASIPRDDIVLAFHPPYKRRLTEFAVA
jgi:hypothetical protein